MAERYAASLRFVGAAMGRTFESVFRYGSALVS
jgi:hypothetical protein